MSTPPWDRYERKFVSQGNRTLIHSTCRTCGLVIIGEGLDTLLSDEDEHSERCRATAALVPSQRLSQGR